ncbi:MAG: hypothetical protein RI894_557 [Bacteroidota bacterium]|jgi:cell fate regulator YaaT (PSP1 superfamily)
MACAGCAVGNRKDATSGCSSGCGSSGCGTGGCNRFNTHDWLSELELPEHDTFDLVEISFKNGSRKGFYHRPRHIEAHFGEQVIVDAEGGYDIGQISLTGELVKLQMKKRNVKPNTVFGNVIRKANPADLDKLTAIRKNEPAVMLQARVIARLLDLDMKLGDVEFQADSRKATFYYTADGRIDFRELIRQYAKEFKVKIEMRQIGARQEAARVGGLGACGRELCCSTWLTDFKSVNTSAARYQNLAINQVKLSGQCGRLKCCLNFELDAYMEAFDTFPKNADKIKTHKGEFFVIKTDIFKGLMFYMARQPKGPALHRTLSTKQVKALMERVGRGENIFDLLSDSEMESAASARRQQIAAANNPNANAPKRYDSNGEEEEEEEYEETDYTGDVDNVVELPSDRNKRRKKAKKPDASRSPRVEDANRPPRTEGDARPPKPPRPPGEKKLPSGENTAKKEVNSADKPKVESKQNPPRRPNPPKGDNKSPQTAKDTGVKKEDKKVVSTESTVKKEGNTGEKKPPIAENTPKKEGGANPNRNNKNKDNRPRENRPPRDGNNPNNANNPNNQNKENRPPREHKGEQKPPPPPQG